MDWRFRPVRFRRAARPLESPRLEGTLAANFEAQADDAELGEVADAIGLGDEPEPAGAGNRTDDEEADDRGQSQALSRCQSGGCQGQQDDRFDQA